MLELVRPDPDWINALEKAVAPPAGIKDRRERKPDLAHCDYDPDPETCRRVSDDLTWLRAAVEEPTKHGLKPIEDTAAVAVWETQDESMPCLDRLQRRGVLDAAGFLLHEPHGDDLS